jgi:ComF family protein
LRLKQQDTQVIPSLLNKIYRIINETVFPPKCLVCSTFLRIPDKYCKDPCVHIDLDGNGHPLSVQNQLEISLATHLCPDCLAQIVRVESPLCTCCGIPFKSRQGQDHYCGACLSSAKNFGFARAPLVYDRIITELIHCFKYRGKIQLARPLGELLLTAFMFFWDKDSIDIILPVPLHPRRFRRRGFNQAHLLIRNWPDMAASGFCDFFPIRIERDVLIRKFPTAPQTALGRTQRAVNIKNAFDVNHQETIVDQRVLLIDDVYTTGATVNECGRLLLSRGAQQVDVLTLARAL